MLDGPLARSPWKGIGEMHTFKFRIQRSLLWMLLPIVACSSVVFAQDTVIVQASLSRESAFVGDEISFVIEIYGASDPEPPVLDIPNGVQAIAHGRTSLSTNSVVFENGQRKQVRQRRYVYQYTLSANASGMFTIPAPIIKDRGEEYVGNSTSFRSVLPSESLDDVLEFSIERQELYQNETIEVECVWWLGDNTSQFNFGSSTIPESIKINPVPVPRGVRHKIDFPLGGETIQGYVSSGIHQGREKSSFTFRFSITPTELGSFEIGPIRSLFTRQPSVGDRFRAYVKSDTIRINVKPVPEDGKSDLYSGAIGAYELETRASNRRVHVGDPIELTLQLQGQEPMTGVQDAPALDTHPGFVDQFKVDSDGWREVAPRRNGYRTYQTTIRALNDEIKEIPPIQIQSFDPPSGTYRTYASQPIPLFVEPVNEVTLADAVVTGEQFYQPEPPTGSRVEQVQLSPIAPALWAHAPIDEMTDTRSFNFTQAIQEPVWIATLVTPPGLYFTALFVIAYRRNRDPEIVRLKQAMRYASQQREHSTLFAYVARVLCIDPEALTAADTVNLHIDDALRTQVNETLIQREDPRSRSSIESDDRTTARRIHAQLIVNARSEAGV